MLAHGGLEHGFVVVRRGYLPQMFRRRVGFYHDCPLWVRTGGAEIWPLGVASLGKPRCTRRRGISRANPPQVGPLQIEVGERDEE
jgi:hypothetical protein